MNIQRVDDAVFLAYIAKYITKPEREPHGILADTGELRARDNMSDAESRCSFQLQPPILLPYL